MKIQETPNGQCFVNIPKALVETLKLKKGDVVSWMVESKIMILERK